MEVCNWLCYHCALHKPCQIVLCMTVLPALGPLSGAPALCCRHLTRPHLPPWGSDTVLPDLALCQVERLSAMVEMSPERTEAVEERVRLQVRSLEWHCCKAARQGLMHLIWSTRGCIGGCMPSRHGLLHLQLAGLPSLMMFSPCMQAAASACKTPPLACNGLGAAGQMTFSGGWHQSVTQGCFGTGC